MTDSIILASPVAGEIHDAGWKRPAGNVEFKVTQPFGCTGIAAEKPLGLCKHFHRGVDLGNGREGAALRAAASGTVRYEGRDGSPGVPASRQPIIVLLDHGDGYWTEYGHDLDTVVSAGRRVGAGAGIAHVGSTGAADPHVHFALRAGLYIPAGTNVVDRYYAKKGDGSPLYGKWLDAWKHLGQNVTVHPDGPGVSIRTTQGAGTVKGPLFATTEEDGHIHRADAKGTDLGLTALPRNWGGTVTGASYTVAAGSSDQWERISLDGGWRYVASLLAVRSV